MKDKMKICTKEQEKMKKKNNRIFLINRKYVSITILVGVGSHRGQKNSFAERNVAGTKEAEETEKQTKWL